MEEALRTSRKRKHQTSNNPLVGIFTRGKTRKYLHHCSRSGKVRPDPVRRRNPVPEVPTNERPARVDVDDDDDIYNVPIKDLRARRVFSKAPLGGECKDGIGKSGDSDLVSENVVCESDESDKLGKEVDLLVLRKCDSGVGFRDEGLNGGSPNLLDECDSGVDFRDGRNPNLSEKCESGVDGRNPNLLEKCESGVDFGEVGSGGGSPNLSAKCDSGYRFRSKGDSNGGKPNSPLGSIGGCGAKGDGAGVLSDVGERLGSEKPEKFDVGLACNVPVLDDMSPEVKSNDSKVPEDEQTTPPDAVILIRQTDDLSVRQNRKAASSSPPKQISPSKDGFVEAKKTFSSAKRNSVLKPCSRQKVFRAPNSFSYRRLLPYLMDIAKDTSSGLKLNPCLKLENDVEEKLTVSSSQENNIDVSKSDEKQVPTVLDCTVQEVSINCEEEKKISLDLKSTYSSAELAVVGTLVDSATDNSRATLVNGNEIVAIMSIDSPKVLPKDNQVSSDNIGKLENASQVAESVLAALSDMSKESIEASPKDASPKSPFHLSLGTEGELKADIAAVETEESPTSVCHSASKLEAIVSSAALVRAEAKGILKRNPRGCRGVCNCLNCSSFRLNAEKAFEFSRNQFLDAEELALDLMKELSILRSMLEKSADGANSHAIVPVDEVQKACRKAFDLEDTARNRLTQMNEDLHVHCRTKPLQRPKVNFSDDFKEEITKNKSSKVTKKPRLAYRTVSTRSSSSLE